MLCLWWRHTWGLNCSASRVSHSPRVLVGLEDKYWFAIGSLGPLDFELGKQGDTWAEHVKKVLAVLSSFSSLSLFLIPCEGVTDAHLLQKETLGSRMLLLSGAGWKECLKKKSKMQETLASPSYRETIMDVRTEIYSPGFFMFEIAWRHKIHDN